MEIDGVALRAQSVGKPERADRHRAAAADGGAVTDEIQYKLFCFLAAGGAVNGEAAAFKIGYELIIVFAEHELSPF